MAKKNPEKGGFLYPSNDGTENVEDFKRPIKGINNVVTTHDIGKKREADQNNERMVKNINRKIDEKTERIKAYRKEASRKAAMANKRLKRLEARNLKSSPAYTAYIQGGGGKFSVKGKTHNQLQAEVARLDRFLNSKTSTIQGLNTHLREQAELTGVKYKTMKELQQKAPKFFELADKVQEYLRAVEQMGSAIGYQKIWEAINVYVQDNNLDLSESELDLDGMLDGITEAIKEHERAEFTQSTGRGYFDTDEGDKDSVWFTLTKED